jgi:predicted ATPase/DNA-binding SARP family transcriptional activator
VEYGILGPFRLAGPDGRERETAPRERDLLALLVLHAGEVLSRERLIDGLWGQALPANPGNALQQRIVHVRRLLVSDDADEQLVTEAGGYRLAAAAATVDVARFERWRERGQAALADGDPAAASAALTAALAEWRGEPLQDVTAPWAAAAISRLWEARLLTLEDRIEADLALGRHAAVTAELDALVHEHPLRERLRGQLMLALAMGGRQADALALYDATRELLAEQLGIDPSPTLQRIHTDVLTQRLPGPASPGDGRRTVTVRALEPPLSGPVVRLPTPASSFVGRERELERLTALLRSDRIVTVTGPGGAGKTRLAIEAARRLHGDDGDAGDVVFVGLATVTDPTAVGPVLADAVGASGPAGTPLTELLTSALRGSPIRLVLDNCEHVVDPVGALVSELAGACANLRVLATSRTSLGVDGEVVWPLDTLPVPAAGIGDLDGALASSAVRLLVERVTAVVPDYRPTDGDVAPMVRIVRELDGLPLAIELAAARARAMSLEEIAERLGDRFGLLAGGRRGAPERHRALTATLDWSWDLLEEPERRAWMAAAVPAQPFTLELLAPLLAAIGVDGEPLDAATALCDRSVLRVEERGNPTRYHMLATLREYGLQRLEEHGAEVAVRSAHADAVEAAVAAADRTRLAVWDVDFAVQRAWLPDVRDALRWRRDVGDRRGMQRLAARLGWLAYFTAAMTEGRLLLDAALGPLDALDSADVEPRAVLWAAALHITDRNDDGPAWAELAVGLADEPLAASLAQMFVAANLALQGDIDGVLAIVDREAGIGGWLEGLWRLLEGKVLTFLGRLDAAEAAVTRAQRLLEEGGTWPSMLAGDILVHLAQLRGDVEAVRRAADRGLRSCQAQAAVELEAELRCLLAMVEAAVGAQARAEAEAARARELTDRTGPAMSAAMLAYTEGYVRWCGGDHAGARDRWEAALDLHDWVGLAYGRPFGLWGLGHLALAAGDVPRAAGLQTASLTDAVERGDRDAVATALEGLAAAELARDAPIRAARLLGAAAVRRRAMGAPEPIVTRAHARRTRDLTEERLGADRYATEHAQGERLPTEALVGDVAPDDDAAAPGGDPVDA